jgi:hypothetical protein
VTRRLIVIVALLGCGKGEGAPPAPPEPAPAPEPKQAPGVEPEKHGEREEKPAPVGARGVSVALVVDGAPRPPVTAAELAKVKGMRVEGDSGEEARDAWSAREVAATLVGPGARVTMVRGEDGKKEVAVEEAAWKDASKIPILRINRRGLVKFFWATADGNPLVAGEVRGVTEIHVSSK